MADSNKLDNMENPSADNAQNEMNETQTDTAVAAVVSQSAETGQNNNGITSDAQPATIELPNEPPPAYDAIYPGAAVSYQPSGYSLSQGVDTVQIQQPQIIYHQAAPAPAPVRPGGCPNCQVGYIVQDFSVVGVLLAIFCFPCGVLCCLLMTERRCTHCNKRF